MVRAGTHPWVSSVLWRRLDPDHLLVDIDLGTDGKYASLTHLYQGDGLDDGDDLLLRLVLGGARGSGVDHSDPLLLEVGEGKWDLVATSSGRYSIALLLRRANLPEAASDAYWSRAEPLQEPSQP